MNVESEVLSDERSLKHNHIPNKKSGLQLGFQV
jgi:hypothetical protein